MKPYAQRITAFGFKIFCTLHCNVISVKTLGLSVLLQRTWRPAVIFGPLFSCPAISRPAIGPSFSVNR